MVLQILFNIMTFLAAPQKAPEALVEPSSPAPKVICETPAQPPMVSLEIFSLFGLNPTANPFVAKQPSETQGSAPECAEPPQPIT